MSLWSNFLGPNGVVAISDSLFKIGRPKQGKPLFQSIPLYTAADENVAGYIDQHRQELDELSGTVLTVVLSEPLLNNEAGWLRDLFEPGPGVKRFPGLKRTHLPCIWLEDGLGGHAVISLDSADLRVPMLICGLIDACAQAANVQDAAKDFNSWSKSAGLARSVQAQLLEEFIMSKA
jgi:hypothetical protein